MINFVFMFNIRKKINAKNAKWLLKLYPPFFFNRIILTHVSEDFTQVDVKVKKSLWNKNLARTIFGGTMFSAADPFIAIMFWQIFALRYNEEIIVWLKSAEIIYKKPANTDLYLHFKISEKEIINAKYALGEKGKYVSEYQVKLLNSNKEICALVNLKSYLGKKR